MEKSALLTASTTVVNHCFDPRSAKVDSEVVKIHVSFINASDFINVTVVDYYYQNHSTPTAAIRLTLDLRSYD